MTDEREVRLQRHEANVLDYRTRETQLQLAVDAERNPGDKVAIQAELDCVIRHRAWVEAYVEELNRGGG